MPLGFTREEWDWFYENRQGCYVVAATIVATGDPHTPFLVETIPCPFCEKVHYYHGLRHGFRRPQCFFDDLPPRMFGSVNDLPDIYVVVIGVPCPMHGQPPEVTDDSLLPELYEMLRGLGLVQHGIDELREMVRRLLGGPEQVP